MNRSAGYTARTTAFATATGITDATILGALNTWDLYIISNGLDTVYKQVLFLAAGTSGRAIVNFMNTSTLTATPIGGLTFSSSGVLGNGTNSYFNSNFKPSVQLSSQNSAHLSFYSNLETFSSWSSMNGGYDGNRFHYYDAGGTNYMAVNTSNLYSNSPSFLKKGTFLINRNNSANFTASNGIVTNTFTDTSTPLVSANLGIGQLLDGSNNPIATYLNLRYSFWTAGSGMTSAQETAHHIGLTTLMTTLGIQ
jgi:hypothetical protein